MNIGHWTTQRAALHPRRPFLLSSDAACNNLEFDERVNRTVQALIDRGVAKGQRVAVLMGNTSTFLEVFFACAKIGAIFVPLNHSLTASELGYIVGDCLPCVLFHAPAFTQLAGTLADQADFELPLAACGPGWIPPAPDVHRTVPGGEDQQAISGQVDEHDPLIIVYTSGTSGDPKGAVLTHRNILFGAIHSLHNYGLNAGYRSLVVAPLFHIGALGASLTPVVYAGGAVLLNDFQHPSQVLDTIVDHGINYMFAVPVMFEMMTQSPRWDGADLSHVHFFIAGGAPMPPQLIRQYQGQKGIRFAQGYGLTETLRVAALDLSDTDKKQGSVGKATFHTRLKIVDDTRRIVPQGSVGEIAVQGPTVFKGYWNLPEKTAAVLEDGWFYTGDLGYLDEDGFLFLKGRKTDMIITSGKNVYAVEVERALERLPQVAGAAVVGVADQRRGEMVVAFVKPSDTPGTACETVDESTLRMALEGHIAAYKIPRRIVFVDELPRNRAGKVMKNRLVLHPRQMPNPE